MPNLADHAALASHDGYRRRLHAALVQRAITTLAGATSTPEQKALAGEILLDAQPWVEQFAWPVAGAASVLAAMDQVGDNPDLVPDNVLEAEVLQQLLRTLAARAAQPQPAPGV